MDEYDVYNRIIRIITNDENDIKDMELKQNQAYCSIKINNQICFKVKANKDNMYLYVKKYHQQLIPKYFKCDSLKSNKLWLRIEINSSNEIDKMDNMILNIFYSITSEPFGCCSRFEECSDLNMCIHPNNSRARGCMYRKNLELGNIFYGKSRNIKFN